MKKLTPIPKALLERDVAGHHLERLGAVRSFGDVLAAHHTIVLVFLRHYG